MSLEAAMSLKRVPTKYIRDGIKANYQKGSSCQICGCTDSLELHHYTSVALLFKKWCKKNKYSTEDVLEIREEFYKEHWHELVEFVVTLCKTHHKALHKVYGVEPLLSTTPKQVRWVERKRNDFI